MNKKTIFSVLTCIIAFFTCFIHVSAKEYNVNMYATETLEEVFTKEGVTNYDLSEYNRVELDDKRVTIYLFRLSGCSNCKSFLNFTANTLLQKYGDKIKIISFEMREDQRNNNLRIDIQKFRGESDNTAPYIIIGNKTWNGPIDSMKQQQIEESIKNIYNTQNKYDIFKDMSGKLFSNNGVTLVSEQSFSPNYTLQVIMTSRQDLILEEGYQFIYSLDITMRDGSNIVPIQNSAPLHIHVSMPGGFDEYKVAYVDANGDIKEVLPATYKDYDLSFTTTHLSEYAIFGKKKDTTQPEEVPPTVPGDNTNDGSNLEQNPDTGTTPEDTNTDKSDTVTEKVPQTLDNIESFVFLFLFSLCAFGISLILYYRKGSKSSM